MSAEDNTLPIGEIAIAYYLDSEGTPIVSTELPDTDAIPAVVQLGMIEMARDTLLRTINGDPMGDDE